MPDGYEVVLGNGGTTSFWDAATFCLIEEQSQHLCFGEFSSKFAAAAKAAPHLKDPQVIESAPGTHPAAGARRRRRPLRPDPQRDLDRGVDGRSSRPQPAAEGLVAVDATSAAGGLPVDPAEFDVYYLAPQKCFASDGGLWVALCRPPAVERVERIAAAGGGSRPRSTSRSRSRTRGSTRPTTPRRSPRCSSSSTRSSGCSATAASSGRPPGATAPPRSSTPGPSSPTSPGRSSRSPTTAATWSAPSTSSTRVDAAAVAKVLRANGILDTEPYRKLGRNQLRIAMFPAIEPDDVAALCGCINYVVGALA